MLLDTDILQAKVFYSAEGLSHTYYTIVFTY